MNAETSAIEVRNLRTQFGEQVIHNNISFSIPIGACCSVIGGSGSGKTTLLNVLLGLLPPAQGSALLFGENIYALDMLARADLIRRSAVLFQEGALFSGLSVLENVAFPLVEFSHLKQKQAEAVAASYIERVGLTPETADKMPNELSGGMKKRAALARALVLRPEILFLDEPTSGLDPIAARKFDDLIRHLHEDLSVTIFMISHDAVSVASLSTQVIALKDGGLLANCTYDELEQHTASWVQQFLSSAQIESANKRR